MTAARSWVSNDGVEAERVIAAVLGDPVQLPLGESSATGYEWQLEPTPAVRVVEPTPDQVGPSAPGDAASQVLTVVPEQLGQLRLHLRLARPWQPDQPIRSITFVLDVRAR
jgi:hypothetical protein